MSLALLGALLLMLIGLIFSILPFVPGPVIIWLGAVFFAWQTDFQVVGWGTVLLLALLAIAATTSDLWVGAVGSRRQGASIWATIFSTIGGIIGLMVLSLPGLLLGSFLGALLPDWRRWRDREHLMRLGGRTLKNWLLGALVQVGLGVVMICVFVLRVALG